MKMNELAKKIHDMAVMKGWWGEKSDENLSRSVGEQFTNFHSELSEAWDEWVHGREMNEMYLRDGKPEGVPVELADCIIRILDTCGAYNIDIDTAIKIKMEYNSTRPYRHGGKKA